MGITIQSPGVEIIERDLSLRAVTPAGTNVLVQGFANSGPVNELLNITTQSELDEVLFPLGTTNAAERYAYYSAKEVLNGNANLYFTRIPYGSGDGVGFQGEFMALAYPMTGFASAPIELGINIDSASATETIIFTTEDVSALSSVIKFPFAIDTTLPISTYNFTLYNDITVGGGGVSAGSVELDYASGYFSANNVLLTGLIGYNLVGDMYYFNAYCVFENNIPTITFTANVGPFVIGRGSASMINNFYVNISSVDTPTGSAIDYLSATYFEIGEPTIIPLKDTDYYDIQAGQIDWGHSGSVTVDSSDATTVGNCGFIVVNDSRSSINEKYEGYYIGLADNSQVKADGFDCIQYVKTINTSNQKTDLPDATMGFTLTGNGSISESIETGYSYDFTNSTFNDSIMINLFKLRIDTSNPDSSKLYPISIEKFDGSFEANDLKPNPLNGNNDTYFLEDKINKNSKFIKMFVNPNISKFATVSTVRNQQNDLNPVGTYAPCKQLKTESKYIGSLPSKIEKALVAAESKESVDIDIVCEAGLGTVWAYVQDYIDDISVNGNGIFQEEVNISDQITSLKNTTVGDSSSMAIAYRTIFNTYRNFVENTRKDCVFIADPLRGIFVQGDDFKTMSVKTRAFTTDIYNPLKNQFASANSSYCITYGNWIKTFDSGSQRYVWMPFSGWQAAIMARLDARLQPWFAPMGLNNGRVQNVVDLAIKTNQKQNDALYRIGINPVTYFQRDGYVVWGQKTFLAAPSAFDRINVRRLFLVAERATEKVMRYFVGEQNTVFTRTRVVNVLTPIFDSFKAQDGLYDFYLVCDEKNNTPQVIDENIMKVDIYIKPTRTAERILVTFTATRTDQDFAELIG